MNAQTVPRKSTIVRANNIAFQATRATFRVLGPTAPGLAARWAERLFLTARRHERPFWEREALASATPGRVRYGSGWLPTWIWTPDRAANDDGALDDPPTVILVHGWEGRGSQLSTFVAPLVERGLRVVTFDAPGHGDSPLARASVIEHARALKAVADRVGRVHAVVAHSVGGAATLFATRLGFTAARYAVIAAPTTPASFATHFARRLALGEDVKREMIARLEARYEVVFSEIDARIDAARLRAPLLVVHDADDPVVDLDNGRVLARTARNGTLVETVGLGHRAILRAPRVVEAVTRFVAEGVAPRTFAETLEGELFVRDSRW